MSDGECVHKMYVLRPCLVQAVTKRRSVVRSFAHSLLVRSFVRSFVLCSLCRRLFVFVFVVVVVVRRSSFVRLLFANCLAFTSTVVALLLPSPTFPVVEVVLELAARRRWRWLHGAWCCCPPCVGWSSSGEYLKYRRRSPTRREPAFRCLKTM